MTPDPQERQTLTNRRGDSLTLVYDDATALTKLRELFEVGKETSDFAVSIGKAVASGKYSQEQRWWLHELVRRNEEKHQEKKKWAKP